MAATCEVNDCGVAAIGRCHECGRAFCMSHQALEGPVAGQTRHVDLCSACLTQRAVRATSERQQAQAADAGSLATISDPTARLVARLALDSRRGIRTPTHRLHEQPAWDTFEVADWFAGMATTLGIAPESKATYRTGEVKRGIFGNRFVEVDRPEPAWWFKEKLPRDARRPGDVFIFPTGNLRIDQVIITSRGSEWANGATHNDPPPTYLWSDVLIQMAERLNLV